jgi:hypothetical protein
MRVIIDRFEGAYAVCEKENREMINIERTKIPSEAKEGDMLLIEQDSIIIDRAGTEKRKSEIQKLMDDLWE